MILSLFFLHKSHQYAKEMKGFISTYVVAGMLAENFELTQYDPLSSLTEEQLIISQLQGWDRHTGNDFFQGKHRGISFTFSDVALFKKKKLDGRDDKVFEGQWLILDLHNKLPAPLMISTLETKGGFDKETKVQVQPEGLGDRFTVLTTSPHVVPQVLTPAFIEYLLTPNNLAGYTFSTHRPHVFFDRMQAHIGLYTWDDLFEPCANVRDIPALRERVQKEIDYIKRIIDGFLLTDGLFAVEGAD